MKTNPTSKLAATFACLLVALSLFGAPLPGRRLANLPAPVRETIRKEIGSGRVEEVTRTNENGGVVYEVDLNQGGLTRSLTIAADGRLTARQVFLNELPPAVQQTIRAQTTGGKVENIYWANDDGEPAYAVEFTRGKDKRGLTVALDGWLEAREVLFAELPLAVQKAVREQLKGATPTHIDRSDEDGEVTFEVTAEANGRARSWFFNHDGKLTGEPVELEEVPAAAQKLLRDRIGGGRLVRTLKSREEGETYYEATYVRAAAKHACTVSADGNLESEELPLAELPEAARKTVAAKLSGAHLGKIEHDPAGGEFTVQFRREGKAEQLIVTGEGIIR